MSRNAEPRKSTEAANQTTWDALTDQERTAIKAAVKAYGDAPGQSVNVAMLYAVRAYQAEMGK
jgi:TRAP-type C4-dicarboxylate transport system substrate-binding protein